MPSRRRDASTASRMCARDRPAVVGPGAHRVVHLRREHVVAALCEQPPQQPAGDLLARPVAVHVRGVEERHPGLDRAPDDRLGGVLVEAPGQRRRVAVAHHAEPDPRDPQTAGAEPHVLHRPSPGGWWIATATMTNPMPARSRGVGVWPSTTRPITVADAGRMLSISANVARRRRFIASWSATYGMTDEHTPTANAAASNAGWVNAGMAARDPDRRGQHGRHEHRDAEPVDRAPPVARIGVGDPVAERDVEHEQRAVGEREQVPERRAGQPQVGEREDAGDREREGDRVAPAADPRRGQHDHAEELDRADRGQREPGDREVEGGVHQRQHHAEGDEQPVDPPPGPPQPPPRREHQGGGDDPQPGDAEHVDAGEQEHGERGPR